MYMGVKAKLEKQATIKQCPQYDLMWWQLEMESQRAELF